MDQNSDVAAERAASYLIKKGIRPSSKAYQYLLFALTQLQCNTPFQNSIWELTAIHFGQKRENVLACIRREITHAFMESQERFSDGTQSTLPAKPPNYKEFLQLWIYAIK